MLTRHPRLRFAEIGEGGDTGAGAEPVVEQSTAEPQQAGGENPAWEPFKTKLDPISYRAIQDDLKALDQSAQSRITSVNEQLKPWKAFADAGYGPEQVQQAITIAKQLNEKPEEIFTALQTYLEREGRLPNKQELKQEVVEQQGDPEAEQQPQTDPRFETLEQQQKMMMEFLQNQHKAEVDRAADDELNSEISALREAHKDLTDADLNEIINRAALKAQSTGKVPTLEEAFADFDALRTRILSTPRPGDSAPQLLPTSGGVPATGGQQKSLGQLSNAETQALMADLLDKNKGK